MRSSETPQGTRLATVPTATALPRSAHNEPHGCKDPKQADDRSGNEEMLESGLRFATIAIAAGDAAAARVAKQSARTYRNGRGTWPPSDRSTHR